jgi:hypothetical protein
MGVAPDKRSLGLATEGRLAVALRGGADAGALIVGTGGRLAIERVDEAPPLGDHDDLVELPLLLWEGRRVATLGVAAAPRPRAAIGITPAGRVLIARGTLATLAPLADTLASAGCTRALVLDRGQREAGVFDRAGTPDAPRSRYDETVLYAIGTALRPRAFRFDPATMVAQAGKGR